MSAESRVCQRPAARYESNGGSWVLTKVNNVPLLQLALIRNTVADDLINGTDPNKLCVSKSLARTVRKGEIGATYVQTDFGKLR